MPETMQNAAPDPVGPAQPQPTAQGAREPLRRRIVVLVRSWVVAFAVAFAILGPFRSAIADWYDVPSGSMEPTILPGDRIIANKLAYGLRLPFTFRWLATWSEPKAGEIVILHSPKDGTRLVKRLVAGPGDRVEMRENHLFLNGRAVAYSPIPDSQIGPHAERRGHEFAAEQLGAHTHAVMATLGVRAIRTFGPITVPQGRYFVMGDNRDNSGDSRYFGFVSRDQIVGRSSAIALSVDPDRSYWPRWERFFSGMR